LIAFIIQRVSSSPLSPTPGFDANARQSPGSEDFVDWALTEGKIQHNWDTPLPKKVVDKVQSAAEQIAE